MFTFEFDFASSDVCRLQGRHLNSVRKWSVPSSHPRCKRVTYVRRATTQGPIRWIRGLTQNSRAGSPKRQLPNCQAGPAASSTPLLRDAQKPWGGHPLWAGPLTTSLRGLWVSGYLPRAMVDRTKRAATLEPTMRQRGRLGPWAGIPKRQLPNCHSCQRGTLKTAWVAHKREEAQRPQCARGKGPEDPSVVAPLHLAQSLGHARLKARGVIGRIGGMPRYVGWLHAQGVGVCCTMTVVNIDPHHRDLQVGDGADR